jgi:hypothetical protein
MFRSMNSFRTHIIDIFLFKMGILTEKRCKSAIPFYEKYEFTKYDKLCEDICIIIKSVEIKSEKNQRFTKYYSNIVV